jgi:hypothetical protein
MTRFSIKEKIEENVAIWLLGTLLTGFLAGIGVYRAVQDMAGLKIVSAADLQDSNGQLAKLKQELAASEKRAAAAAARAKQAYSAVRGTRVNIIHMESDVEVATELRERLLLLDALVTLTPTERKWFSDRGGKLYHQASGLEAAMQIKALASDIALLTPEDSADSRPGEVSVWLLRR